MTAPSPRADARRRYTIEELSKRSRLSARTIRFYQTEGTLHPPAREGRVAYYDGTHLDRLRLIVDLKSRGLTLSAIQALIKESEGEGLSVEQWLRGGRRRERAPRPVTPQQAPNYQPWIPRETPPPPPVSHPPVHEQASPRVQPQGQPQPRATSWRSLAWGVTAFALALCTILLATMVLSLQEANDDRDRLRRDVAALQDRVQRFSAQSQAGAPVSSPLPPPLSPPVPAPPAPAPPVQGGSSVRSPDRDVRGTTTTGEPASPGPAPPVEPAPSTPPTTAPSPPPCTVLPILQRCL